MVIRNHLVPGGWNTRKRVVLRVLNERTDQPWISVPDLAQASGIVPMGRAYALLARYARFGLIVCHRATGRRMLVRITPIGRQRLAWLRHQDAERVTR